MKNNTFTKFMSFIKVNKIVPDFLSESPTWQLNVKVVLNALENFSRSELGKEYINELQKKENITIIKGVSNSSCKECG